MNKDSIILECKVRWWVHPYIWIASAIAWPLAFVLDDEQIEAWVAAQSAFIIDRGVVLRVHDI